MFWKGFFIVGVILIGYFLKKNYDGFSTHKGHGSVLIYNCDIEEEVLNFKIDSIVNVKDNIRFAEMRDDDDNYYNKYPYFKLSIEENDYVFRYTSVDKKNGYNSSFFLAFMTSSDYEKNNDDSMNKQIRDEFLILVLNSTTCFNNASSGR
ncbi:hypothetical protein N9901_02555 [Flavobacteriaceae bacterium]|nr:hypothetical protein [Flavobacteriaceae bacterium]